MQQNNTVSIRNSIYKNYKKKMAHERYLNDTTTKSVCNGGGHTYTSMTQRCLFTDI